MIQLFLFVLFLVSCAPLSDRRPSVKCPDPKDLFTGYSFQRAPKEFRVYGTLKYGPLKMPILIAKFDGIYTVKVPKERDIRLDERHVCLKGRCYLLPIPPENLIFGGVLLGKEVEVCKGGKRYMVYTEGVYERTVVFVDSRLVEYRVRNIKNNKVIKVRFGPLGPGGYFREILIETEGMSFKLLIEEVET